MEYKIIWITELLNIVCTSMLTLRKSAMVGTKFVFIFNSHEKIFFKTETHFYTINNIFIRHSVFPFITTKF